MKNTTVELGIYSPRWGHEDVYKFALTKESMSISHMPRTIKCTWVENRDPEWSGEDLEKTLRNDSIYPPSILPDLFAHAWLSWRNGELDDQGVAIELKAIARWLNEITAAKPKTEFWKTYF